MMNQNKVWLPLILAAVLAAGMYLGYLIKGKTEVNAYSYGNNPLMEVISYMKGYYVEDVKDEEIYEKSIVSILENLDPHSVYIPSKELKDVNDEMTGNFEGIGVEFFIVNDTIQVVTPISGGPSEQLGIQAGDKIIRINDSLVAGNGITNKDVVKKLKGPKGTSVKVSISRLGTASLIDYTIRRDKIPLYSVDAGFQLDSKTGYIRINRFSETTYDEFMEKLKPLKQNGIEQLIIDLRQNPGGYLQMAVKIVDELLEGNKEIVFTEGRKFPRQSMNAGEKGIFEKGKVAILIDEGSASASEIVAGAIQDWDRGIIVGRRSFGKGLVQEQFPLSDGSALRLTIAKYFTPSGRCIQKPYEGGLESYNEDINKRFKDGEVFGKTDSTKNAPVQKAFTTKVLKRKVYDGGGISPDYFIPYDSTQINDFSLLVLSQGWLQEFVYQYYAKHKSDFNVYKNPQDFSLNYKISDELYQQFVAFVKTKKPDEKMTKSAPASKKELSTRLAAHFAKQKWGYEGFYAVIAGEDDAVKKAVFLLNQVELFPKK
jgi:carboxyl-terminal processing protease